MNLKAKPNRFDAAGIKDLSTGLWIGLPVFVLLFSFVADALYFWLHPLEQCIYDYTTRSYDLLYCWLVWSEFGVIELLTVMFALTAFVCGMNVVRRADAFEYRWLKWYFFLGATACFILLGEELSWGQHFFGWTTPEYWRALNTQQETNLHNAWPVTIYYAHKLARYAIVLGCLMLPVVSLACGWKGRPGGWAYWVMPTYVCMPAAMGMVISYYSRKQYPYDHGLEVYECFIAMILFFYLWSVFYRLKQYIRKAEKTGSENNSP